MPAPLPLSVAILLLDHDVVNIASLVARSLCVILEAYVGTVVERTTTFANSHNLDTTDISVRDVDTGGEGKLFNEESASIGGVEELGCEGDVEVGGVLAETEVDKDVGPVVVKIECKRTALEGPVSEVLLVVVNTSTWCLLVEENVSSACGYTYRDKSTGCSGPRSLQ
ncbi:hypothetical protein HG531_001941 [Fusarium graminearum]|nr:hypothetical protein HG531_001941 [Fusarium graminearum]